jgi:ribonuclease HI
MYSVAEENKISFSEIVWTDGGCNAQTIPEGWGSVVDDHGRDLLCRQEVSVIIKDLKHRVEVLPEGKASLGGPRTILISKFTDVKTQQNNGAELLAMVAALRVAAAFPVIKIIKCDSELIFLWWSKGHVSKGSMKTIDNEKMALIEECGILRKQFENRGGKIMKIKGAENKADLGMHKN